MLQRLPIEEDDGLTTLQRPPHQGGVGRGPEALPFSSVVRLVPHSGVQFIDLTIPTDRLALVQHRFIVESAAPGTDLPDVLVPLPAMSDGDGLEWHPITRQPLRPEATRWLTGFDGVETFLGRWLPLPYFRFIGRTPEGRLRFDKGPTNWARLYIAHPTSDLRSATTLRAVLAFDTKLTVEHDGPASEDRLYLAPTPNDAQFGSTFLLSDEPEDLGEFLGEPWLDQWLSALMPRWQTEATPRPKLDHLARYLALLRVLQTSRVMPELRLVDTFSTRFPVTTENVDLVLDIGDATTTALLIASNANHNPMTALSQARPLPIRHLGRPTIVQDGPIPTAIEFDEPPFGDAHASRRSGRADAFLWPSMARIGTEALALQTRDLATPGTTGLTNLRTKITDTALHGSVWRIARDAHLTAAPGGAPGPVASGVLLGLVTEDGSALPKLLAGPSAKSSQAALRPRFSQSAMMTQFLAELFLQAITSLNAAQRADSADRQAITLRQLDRIVISIAAGTPDAERRHLLERAQDAVDILWRALGWANPDHQAPLADPPRVVAGLGPDLAAQVVYIHDNVRQHFGNDAATFIELTRRPRNATRLSPDLKIASIDGSNDRTTFALVDYALINAEPGQDGGLQSSLARAAALPIGADHMVHAIAENILAPAIARALTQAGIENGDRFLADVRGPWHLAAPINDPHFAPRFSARVLLPAARTLLASVIANAGRRGVEIETRLEPLVTYDLSGVSLAHRTSARPSTRLGATSLALMFDAAAERAGAMGLRLADIPIRVRWLDIERVTRPVVDRLLDALKQSLTATDVDLVLLTGPLFDAPQAIDAVRAALPVPAHRVVEMSKGRYALIETFGTDVARPTRAANQRPWLTGAIGAFIASRPDTSAVPPQRRTADRQIADHRQNTHAPGKPRP